MVATHLNTGKPVVASEYGGVLGVPAFFQRGIFPELLQLKCDVGAKVIIQRHKKEVASVAFSNGIVDIDSAIDYEELSKSIHRL